MASASLSVVFTIVTEESICELESVRYVKTTDKEALALKVAEITNADLEEADYTEDSWAALQEALTQANAVLADEKATEAEVADAAEKLEAAYAGLIKADSVTDPEDPSQNGSSTGADGSSTDDSKGNQTTVGNDSSNSGNQTSGVKSTVKTGDEAQVMFLAVVCLMALCGITAVLYYRKRVKRER